MLRLLQAYWVELATLERAVGSGDEKLVHELRTRFEPEVRRRSSDLRDDADARQIHLHDAIGELIDGVLTVPEHPRPYEVALELLCRRIGVRAEVGPFGDVTDEEIARRDKSGLINKLCSNGPPLARLAPLSALGTIGHLTPKDLAVATKDKTLVGLRKGARDGWVLVGFSGFH